MRKERKKEVREISKKKEETLTDADTHLSLPELQTIGLASLIVAVTRHE
jgi:hypothetical protein